jgi:hypothetical protein
LHKYINNKIKKEREKEGEKIQNDEIWNPTEPEKDDL